MNMIYTITTGRCDALVAELRAEYGAIAVDRILEAEAVDFLWDARVREHYRGQHSEAVIDDEGAPPEVSRVAFLSLLDGRWHAGICLVDGEGAAVDMLWKRRFGSRQDAEFVFLHAR